jgi:excisionase family DNA binding protein
MTGWRTLDELADELRVSRRTVERWIARGEPGLDVLRLGGTATGDPASSHAERVPKPQDIRASQSPICKG